MRFHVYAAHYVRYMSPMGMKDRTLDQRLNFRRGTSGETVGPFPAKLPRDQRMAEYCSLHVCRERVETKELRNAHPRLMRRRQLRNPAVHALLAPLNPNPLSIDRPRGSPTDTGMSLFEV